MKRFAIITLSLLVGAVAATWMMSDPPPVASAESLSAPAPSVRPFDKQQARLVWCRQVVGMGTDPFALGPNFVLMALDTQDGKGERVLLGQTGNYARPMLTPDGNRVVYSNRLDGHVHIVGFDGGNHAKVLEGFAVDVWRDPETGHDWLYYILNVHQGETTDGSPLKRCRLDHPSPDEVVWDRSQVTTDNVQLSADGTRLAGLFPWSRAAMLNLASGKLTKMGKGCWTSMAPDDSYAMWIFDGAHKNLLLKLPGDLFSRKIAINTAPGTEGFEVYHPRWSNHVRYLAMTGPYKVMAQYNAIQGGGSGINLYVGRFDPEFTEIEEWTQVTNADEADFFPDLWISGGAGARSGIDPTKTPVTLGTDTWPSSQEGLVFIWENVKANNSIDDPTNGLQRDCNVARLGWATFGSEFDADLDRGGLRAVGAEEWMADALMAGSGWTVEFTVGPISGRRPEEGLVLGQASSLTDGNFAVIEKQGALFLRMATSEQAFGPDADVKLLEPHAKYHTHVVLSYEADRLTWYVNGESSMVSTDVRGDTTGWGNHPFVMGRLPDGSADWPGRLEGVLVYGRTLRPEEIVAHFQVSTTRLRARKPIPTIVVKATLTHRTPTPTVESIKPYRAGLVEYVYRIDEVLSGDLADEEVIVQHWAILDAVPLPVTRELNRQFTLSLQPLGDHPQLEGERVSSDVDDPTLEPFVEIGWKEQVGGSVH